jgi:hypothetical protein
MGSEDCADRGALLRGQDPVTGNAELGLHVDDGVIARACITPGGGEIVHEGAKTGAGPQDMKETP